MTNIEIKYTEQSRAEQSTVEKELFMNIHELKPSSSKCIN
jgi:hypothetical protein